MSLGEELKAKAPPETKIATYISKNLGSIKAIRTMIKESIREIAALAYLTSILISEPRERET